MIEIYKSQLMNLVETEVMLTSFYTFAASKTTESEYL